MHKRSDEFTTSSSVANLKMRYSTLDSFRGIAILMVLIHHLYQSFYRGYATYSMEGWMIRPPQFPRSLNLSA